MAAVAHLAGIDSAGDSHGCAVCEARERFTPSGIPRGRRTNSSASFTLGVSPASWISAPRSRTNPQFNGDVLPQTLSAVGIAYVALPSLGGLRGKSKTVDATANAGWQQSAFRNYADYAETAPFREGLRELLDMVLHEACAIMCAEAVWWRCHRRIVADQAIAHGVRVVHLFSREKGEPASLTPFAVVRPGGRVSYPAG